MNDYFFLSLKKSANQKKQVETRVAGWLTYFQTKILGKFWIVLKWKVFVNFMVIWYILGVRLVYFSRFGMFYKGKSGNTG
jgi:hypothetical protein